MTFNIRQVMSDVWIGELSELTHTNAFGEWRSRSLERFDFTLMATNELDEACAYITCKEMDSETVYWQYGGALLDYKKSFYSLAAYSKFVEWCSDKYKRITTKIENTNPPMIKMAMKMGFVIDGVCTFKTKTYLTLTKEFENDSN